MANPELGTKQICPTCQAKFYDLNRRPAHCPKCQSDFDPDEAVRNRRVRARIATPEADPEEAEDQVAAKTPSDEDEDEDPGAPELDEVVDEPPLSTDDDDDGADTPAVSEDLGAFTEEEEVEAEDDVPFLEDEEDDDFDESEIDGLPDGDDDR